MNRRGFFKACFTIGAAAVVAKAMPWAPEPVAENAFLKAFEAAAEAMRTHQLENCMRMSYVVMHPKQLAAFKRSLGAVDARFVTYAGIPIIPHPCADPNKPIMFQDLSPSDAGYWRPTCPT